MNMKNLIMLALISSANLNAINQNQQLLQAAFNGNLEQVKAFLKAGADVNAKADVGRADFMKDWTVLIRAAYRGHTQVVKTLLKAPGIKVNATDNVGGTALIWAAINGYSQVVKALLKAGADVNATDNAGGTALMYAAREGHLPVVKTLLKAGADVNAKNKSSKTALELATNQRIRTLLEQHLRNRK